MPRPPAPDARRFRATVPLLACLALAVPGLTPGEDSPPLRADADHVRTWNLFADDVYQLHLRQLRKADLRTESRIGGYPASMGGADFYREVYYHDAGTDRPLSRIRWVRDELRSIHSIEVFVHDDEGRLALEYFAAYLPDFRNAPIQTFVNMHKRRGELRAFRQFDATGRRLYEQCRGSLNGESVWLERDYFPVDRDLAESRQYVACFAGLPDAPGERLDPLHGGNDVRQWPVFVPDSRDELDRLIEQYDRQIPVTPSRGDLRIKRGDALFLRGEFRRAIDDYEAALEIDTLLDWAWFGRGMARARLGDIEAGIEDMNVFLQRNPESSLGYTKRGIRYLWLGDLERAEEDFREALRLDPDNAEAHSDLGVLLAQRQEFDGAVHHMQAAVHHDPTYRKAHHNLAMVHFLDGRPAQARESVERALALNPRARDSMLLKGEILEALGDEDGARRAR